MKILVTGANGQVGWELARSCMPLGEVVALDRHGFDLSRPETLAARIAVLHPDVIINAAAYTAVDKAESEEALATVINGESVGAIGEGAKHCGALVLHYSTDYVFSGEGEHAHREDEATAPLNAYGRSKLAGELALQASGADHLILRTTWVYGVRGANFVRTMLRLGRERDSLGVVADQIGAPTWSRNIADASAQLARMACVERQQGRFQSAVLNLTSSGETSWHAFACAIFEEARRCMPEVVLKVAEVKPIPASAYPTPARRPGNSRMDGSVLAQRYGIRMPHWRDALVSCLEDMGVSAP